MSISILIFFLLTNIWKSVHLWRNIVNRYFHFDRNIQTGTSSIVQNLVFNVSYGQFNPNVTIYLLPPTSSPYIFPCFTSITCHKQVDSKATHVRVADLYFVNRL